GGYAIISSDCYQWRILQLMRIYRSVQPLDKALFPTTLFKYYKKAGFQLLHYDGFALPGEGYRFLRMVADRVALLSKRLMRKMVSSFAKSYLRSVTSRPAGAVFRQRGALLPDEEFISETRPQKLASLAFLKIIVSDENVFFLRKL
ncbi:MAG: hypothetical protein M1358_19360, partial [Chloroflexi bacterium]|nr:hypothetical protein [Chloroflexota bacterium]